MNCFQNIWSDGGCGGVLVEMIMLQMNGLMFVLYWFLILGSVCLPWAVSAELCHLSGHVVFWPCVAWACVVWAVSSSGLCGLLVFWVVFSSGLCCLLGVLSGLCHLLGSGMCCGSLYVCSGLCCVVFKTVVWAVLSSELCCEFHFPWVSAFPPLFLPLTLSPRVPPRSSSVSPHLVSPFLFFTVPPSIFLCWRVAYVKQFSQKWPALRVPGGNQVDGLPPAWHNS